MKGLSNVVVFMIILAIVIVSILPTIYVAINNFQNNSTIQYVAENYVNYHSLYQEYITDGIIQITYNVYYQQGVYYPTLTFSISSQIVHVPLSSLNITMMFYLQNGQWRPIPQNYPINIPLKPLPYTINLPPSSQPYDIVIILNVGVMVFLAPNATT